MLHDKGASYLQRCPGDASGDRAGRQLAGRDGLGGQDTEAGEIHPDIGQGCDSLTEHDDHGAEVTESCQAGQRRGQATAFRTCWRSAGFPEVTRPRAVTRTSSSGNRATKDAWARLAASTPPLSSPYYRPHRPASPRRGTRRNWSPRTPAANNTGRALRPATYPEPGHCQCPGWGHRYRYDHCLGAPRALLAAQLPARLDPERYEHFLAG